MLPTSTDEQTFGDKDDPKVDVGLPFDLVGRMSYLSLQSPQNDRQMGRGLTIQKFQAAGKCGFYFASHGGNQKRSWHDMWEAATAIWGMCGKNKKLGFVFVGSECPIDAF